MYRYNLSRLTVVELSIVHCLCATISDLGFIRNHHYLYRVWYMLVSMLCCRAKYYVAFTLGTQHLMFSGKMLWIKALLGCQLYKKYYVLMKTASLVNDLLIIF